MLWQDAWQQVLNRAAHSVHDLAAVFKSEYDDVAWNLHGAGRSPSSADATGASQLRLLSVHPDYDLNSALLGYARHNDGGYTGADSTYFRRLPNGDHVLMSSDTFLGEIAVDGSRAADTQYVNNSFVVTDKYGNFRTVLDTSPEGWPQALVPPKYGQFHWLGGHTTPAGMPWTLRSWVSAPHFATTL